MAPARLSWLSAGSWLVELLAPLLCTRSVPGPAAFGGFSIAAARLCLGSVCGGGGEVLGAIARLTVPGPCGSTVGRVAGAVGERRPQGLGVSAGAAWGWGWPLPRGCAGLSAALWGGLPVLRRCGSVGGRGVGGSEKRQLLGAAGRRGGGCRSAGA